MKWILPILVLTLIVGCSDEPTGPATTGEDILIIPVTSTSESGFDVAMWKPGMSAPQVVIANAYISGPPCNGKIAVVRWTGDSSYIIVANIDGSDQRIVHTKDERIRSVSLSHDAAYIAFCYNHVDLPTFVYSGAIISVVGGSEIRVAYATGWENLMHWAPTENKLAFIATGEEYSDPDSLMIINADGSGRTLLSLNVPSIPDDSDMWRWNSDGSGLIYIDEDFSGVIEVDAVTGNEADIFRSDSIGTAYVLNGRDATSSYYMVNALLDAPPESTSGSIGKFDAGTRSLTAVLALPVGSVPFYLDLSNGDDYMSYSEILIDNGAGDPTVRYSPIKVRDQNTGTVIDLGVKGGKAYWNRK